MGVGWVPDWLARRAETHGGLPALIAGASCWSFAELDRRVGMAAGNLAARGVRPGDRVGLLARNSAEYVVAMHAAGRLGAVLVPLNVRLTPAEIAWQLADAEVSLLLHDAANRDAAAESSVSISGLRRDELGAVAREPAGEPVPAPRGIELDRVMGIVYTSGTTGRPKGAMLTFGNLWASAGGSALHLGHHRDDRWLAAMPLFHVGGLSILFRSVIGGVPVVLHEGFDPADVNRAIDEEQITLISVVANMLQRMLDERGDRPYPSSLRCVLLGGGPAPQPLLERCLRLGVPVAPTYGLTESCSQATTLLPDELADHLGSSGRPLPVTEVRIEHDGRPADAGEVGEIAVRGATVIPGYLRQPARSEDGWFRTSDIGWMDEDGYLFVLNRRDDLIVSGGENVYPAEVEAALLMHPDVEEVAVVGIPDERWGEVPAAFVRVKAGTFLDERALIDVAGSRLAPYKRPRRIEWVEALPRNAGGKVLRRELRDRLVHPPSRD